MLYGNYHYTQGEFGRATISYIRGLEGGGAEPFIHYNLGNVYHALGEAEAAVGTLESVLDGDEGPELASRVNFNLGSIAYQLGRYEQAVARYVDALSADPDDVEALLAPRSEHR